MSTSNILAIFFCFLIWSCSDQNENQNQENQFVGAWESVSNSGSNAKTVLKISFEEDSLTGYLEYSTLATSGLKMRNFGKSNFKGSFSGDVANVEILDSLKTPIGKAQLYLEGDSLKYITVAEGVDFPAVYFKKRTAEVAKQETDNGTNENHWHKMRSRGVEFKATGNEPFWSVELNVDGKIYFSSLTDIELLEAPIPNPVYGDEGKMVRYKSVTDAGLIDVVIQRMPCTDNMSGMEFEHFVSVEVKKAGDAETRVFKGCGSYLGDIRLHDIWALISMDDVVYSATSSAERPYFEFNLSNKRVMGNGGCNEFQGGFSLGNQVINFGEIASTRKYCEGMDLEQKILEMITNQSLKYSIGSGELRLEGRNGNLKFRKVD